jgi:aryl-alcohol dehydrogenase-like predicted oxidoreductase
MRWDSEEGSDPWNTQDNSGKPVVVRKNSRPDSIAYECEQSLKRLGVDVIDLYQIHWPDVSTPVEDSIAAMLKLKDQGKVRAIGVSNYDVEWMRKAVKVAPLASNQPPYSLIQRKIEQEMVPFTVEHRIGLIVYSPLERGLLTGKVTPDRQFNEGDHRAKHKYFTVENRKRVLATLERIKPIADKYGASYTQVVINWTVQQPGITAALVGARNAEQAAHNAQALRFELSTEELKQIREAFDEASRELNAGPGGTTARQ